MTFVLVVAIAYASVLDAKGKVKDLNNGLDKRPINWYLKKTMNTVSISQLKMRPAQVIAQAADYPVAVRSRNSIKAYLVGRTMYEKLVETIEDLVDAAAVKRTNFRKGKDFEKVAADLGI